MKSTTLRAHCVTLQPLLARFDAQCEDLLHRTDDLRTLNHWFAWLRQHRVIQYVFDTSVEEAELLHDEFELDEKG